MSADLANQNTAKIDGLHTVFKWTAAIFTIIYGFLNDKFPRKKILVIGALAYSICSIITAYITSYNQLVIMQMITAITIGASLPTSYSILSDLYPPEKRSRIFGFFGVATIMGDVIGAVLVSMVYPINPETYTPLDNWRQPFLIIGIFTLFIAVLVIFIVKEPKRGASEHFLDEILTEESIDYSYRIRKEDFSEIYKNKTNFWLIINFVDNIMGGYMLAKAVPWLVEDKGAAPEVAGMLILIPALAILSGTIVGGVLGDKLYKKKKNGRAMVCLIGITIGTIIMPFALLREYDLTGLDLGQVLENKPFLIAFSLFFLFFFFNNLIGPNWHSIIIDTNRVEVRGTMLSIAVFFEEFGEGLGIILGALIHDALVASGGYAEPFTYTFMFLTLFNIGGILFWIPLVKRIGKDIDQVEKLNKERAKLMKTL